MIIALKKIIKNSWIIFLLAFLALLVRFYFLDKYTNVSGDLLLYADWGKYYWEYGSRSFYFIKNWYYAPPNYPPLVNLYYAYAYKAYDYKYLFAQLHNLIKFPPAAFIVYYYKWGYFINLKLLAVVCDILIGILIYIYVDKTFRKRNLAIIASSLYLFNPASIILSSIWGQTDSVIAYFSILSFILLFRKKFTLSASLFTAGILFKPNWIVFVPLYVLTYFLNRPKNKSIILSFISLIILLFAVSYPFSSNPVTFYSWLIKNRILTTIGASKVASVSAFNFFTTFLRIDYHQVSYKILGIGVGSIGQLIFSLIYLISLIWLISKFLGHKKIEILDIFKSIVLIGLGSFLFMPGILERYFFPAIIPFATLAVVNKKYLVLFLSLTLTFSLNIIWALFRRHFGVLDHVFTDNNFLLIKVISIYNLIGFYFLLRLILPDNLLKLSLWKKQASIWIRRLS